MKRPTLGMLALLAGMCVAGGAPPLWPTRAAAQAARIEGVDGPADVSVLNPEQPARITDFQTGGAHRLAILVTDPASQWLGLARLLRAQGVPFIITQDPAAAFEHQVVLVYPIISGRSLTPEALRGIARHVHDGGAVLGFDLQGGGLEALFGASTPIPSRARETLHWADTQGLPEETLTRFSRAGSETELGSYAYTTQSADIIARYEDGAAAITCRRAVGVACLMGVDIGDVAQRAMDGRAEPIARSYVNRYEPSLDVLGRWLRDFYVSNEPAPFLISTAPAGRDVSIVLSHDIDYTRSVANARAYAELERENAVTATYFIQTKYIRDYNDDVFFTAQTVPDLRALHDAGMEIASHTVAHTYAFRTFPLGTGQERYSDYAPFVQSRNVARGGSLFGETRVSKFLLEHFVGGPVVSFRPGHLSYPFNLPEVLHATGYSFSSSITANSSLSHLPFQTTYGRAGRSLEPVWEFPVTIEDEEAPRLGDRIVAANSVIAAIAAHRGMAMILIHPDVLDHKLAFERALIERWRDTAWITDLNTFGSWWRARDLASVDLVDDGEGLALTIDSALPLNNVEILLPKAQAASSIGEGYRLEDGRLTIEHMQGQRRISIEP